MRELINEESEDEGPPGLKDSDDEGADEKLQNKTEKDVKLTSRWNRRIKATADSTLGVGPILVRVPPRGLERRP